VSAGFITYTDPPVPPLPWRAEVKAELRLLRWHAAITLLAGAVVLAGGLAVLPVMPMIATVVR
jgi:hypothetical protein